MSQKNSVIGLPSSDGLRDGAVDSSTTTAEAQGQYERDVQPHSVQLKEESSRNPYSHEEEALAAIHHDLGVDPMSFRRTGLTIQRPPLRPAVDPYRREVAGRAAEATRIYES